MPKYIRTELAAIRFFHKRLGSKNKLPTNKQLGIMPNDDYKYNRAFLPNEFKDMIWFWAYFVCGVRFGVSHDLL